MFESRWTVLWGLLLFLPVCFGPPPDRFTLTVPDGPFSVWVGSSITLPCSFSPAFTETLHMRWHRHGKYKTPLLLYEKQKLQESPTDPQFRGRVSLDGQLEMGDVSLTLVNATLEDSGEFICFVASEKSEDHASIHLTVKALGSAPVLSVTDGGSGQVNVTCVSDGWSPQPTVTWRDREGAVIYGHSDHTATDARGFLTVTSSLLRSSSASEWISCSVGLSEWDSKEGRILPYISETNTGPWKEVSITLMVLGLLMMFAIIALLFILCRRGNKTTTQSQDGHTGHEDDNKLEEGASSQKQALEMPSLEMVKRFKESPTMDETTIQGDLKLGLGKRVSCSNPMCSQTLNTTNYVLCRDKFVSGQHYWEINVYNDKLSWCVGVCSDALRGQGGVSLRHQSNCWLLCFNKGHGLFVTNESETLVQAADTSINTIGVYLDCSGDSLAFYDVESKSCLSTVYDVSSDHPLVPVLSPGGRDNSVMALID